LPIWVRKPGDGHHGIPQSRPANFVLVTFQLAKSFRNRFLRHRRVRGRPIAAISNASDTEIDFDRSVPLGWTSGCLWSHPVRLRTSAMSAKIA